MVARVLLVSHDPVVLRDGGRRLHEVLKWNDPDVLVEEYVREVGDVSNGYAHYEIVERVVVDAFPTKQDGFQYTEQQFLRCWQSRSGFHQPDQIDYHRLLDEFAIVPRVNSGAIDEVWLFGFPYAGYYESIMAGPDAFWCNAPPLQNTSRCARRFVMMGFNYERGVGEMLEGLGHRAESIIAKVYEGKRGDANLWERFTRCDRTHPGRAEVGSVHFAPNSVRDYDWGNPRMVLSRCDDWFNFPNFKGITRAVNCREWGNGDTRLHHKWWLRHIPHAPGTTDGISNNWWSYILDPNNVP